MLGPKCTPPEKNIGRIVVSEDGFIFEITAVDYMPETMFYIGVDIFSGKERRSIYPVKLNPAVVKTLMESLRV